MTTRKKRVRSTSASELDGFWPSHTPFDQILDYPRDRVAGDRPRLGRDHVAELSQLLSYDTDPAFWFVNAIKEGIRAREPVDILFAHSCLTRRE